MVFLLACQENHQRSVMQQEPTAGQDAIFFASLNQAVHLGQYGGVMTIGDLTQHGNLGVGSTEKLAYELVLLDGTAYGIPADGQVYELPDTTRVAFAAVKHFQADQQLSINTPMTLKALEARLDSVLNGNAYAALRIQARFASLQYRSFEVQQPPFQPTDSIPEVTFERAGMDVIMAGFYTPQSGAVFNSPVYHFHFIAADKSTGGHLLDGELEQATIEIDYAQQLHINLADTALLQHIDMRQPVEPK